MHPSGICYDETDCREGLECGKSNCGLFPNNTNHEASCCYDPFITGYSFDIFSVAKCCACNSCWSFLTFLFWRPTWAVIEGLPREGTHIVPAFSCCFDSSIGSDCRHGTLGNSWFTNRKWWGSLDYGHRSIPLPLSIYQCLMQPSRAKNQLNLVGRFWPPQCAG